MTRGGARGWRGSLGTKRGRAKPTRLPWHEKGEARAQKWWISLPVPGVAQGVLVGRAGAVEALDAHADELEPLLPEYTRVDPER